MMVNIINITMTFTDNDKPKLEYIDLQEILSSEIDELKILSDDEMLRDIKYIDLIDYIYKKIKNNFFILI